MLLRESLVLKLCAVDRLAACTIALGEVTALNHELLDDAVEDGALVMQGLAGLAQALLAGAEAAEVLGRLGDEVVVELHGNTACGLTADCDIKEHARARRLVLGSLGGHCDCVLKCKLDSLKLIRLGLCTRSSSAG